MDGGRQCWPEAFAAGAWRGLGVRPRAAPPAPAVHVAGSHARPRRRRPRSRAPGGEPRAALHAAPDSLIDKLNPRELAELGAAEEVGEPLQYGEAPAGVDFPKPLTAVQRAQRAFSFWTRVVPILVRYRLAKQKADSMDLSPREVEEMYDELHEWGSTQLSETIQDLLGFYVKSGQVISTRVDLFPEAYTSKLQVLQDSIDPIPTSLIKAIVSQELLEGEPIETLFRVFDQEPLGSASIAQVHRAELVDGRVVAVKVQRPAEEPKLRGDVNNLKAFAQRFQGQLPVDYYTVFCELERALTNELDFLAEAQSIEKIAAAVAHMPNGTPAKPSVYIPRPIPGLVSKRVLVMEYVDGVALNGIQEQMKSKGFEEDGPEVKLFGKVLLTSLSEAFGRMIFGPGFIHGDPHPGNIFCQEPSTIAIIDCGQVKQIPSRRRLQLADLILAVADWGTQYEPSVKELAQMVREFGVETDPEAGDECLASLALLLFGPPGLKLPGGYSNQELSKESPLRRLTRFPQELVMLGRATVLIKGISSRVGIPWNLSEHWAEPAQQALECGEDGCMVPIYAATPPPVGGSYLARKESQGRPKFRDVWQQFVLLRRYFADWITGKSVEMLPGSLKKALMRRAGRKITEESQR